MTALKNVVSKNGLSVTAQVPQVLQDLTKNVSLSRNHLWFNWCDSVVNCIQNACINTSCPSYFLYLPSQEVECTGISIILNSGEPVWLPWRVEFDGSETIWFPSKLPVVAKLLPKYLSIIIPWGDWEFNVKQIEENQTMVLHNWCYIIVILRDRI